MKGISINREKLHEVKMLMVPYDSRAVMYLSYPKNRITFHADKDEIVLSIPPMLAIELYRRGILPQDENQSFPIHVSGKRIGTFRVIDFRYSNSHFRESVTITMRKHE